MKPLLVVTCAVIASLYSPLAHSLPPVASGSPVQRIASEKLCVTNGVVSTLPDGRLTIETSSARAIVRIATTQTAEIRFRYVGPSKGAKPLASGELRRQIGLKLRAQDTCNLLYAMWHIEPNAKIAVSLKRNAGQHTHEECGAGGYVNIRARRSVEVPQIRPGEWHTLHAELHGTALTIIADGAVVWEGTVGNDLAQIDGPVGFRTDNVRVEFEYYAGSVDPDTPPNMRHASGNRCLPSSGD